MLTLKLFWTYVKKYWGFATLVLGFIVGILVMFWTGRSGTDWQQKIDELQNRHLKEIDQIRADEEKKNQELVKKYEQTMNDIQRQYDEKQKVLEEDKKREIEQIIKQYGKDPVQVTQQLSDLLPGVEVKMPEEF